MTDVKFTTGLPPMDASEITNAPNRTSPTPQIDPTQNDKDHKTWLQGKTICEDCHKILEYIPYWDYEDPNTLAFTSHEPEKMVSSAQECPLCELFLQDLGPSVSAGLLRGIPVPDDWKRGKVFAEGWSIATPIRWPNTDLRGVHLEIWDREKSGREFVADLHLYESAKESSEFVEMASIVTDCEKSWKVAKGWMDECMASHDECRQSIMPGDLPTRLVYVGNDSSEARLCLSKELESDTKYLALSHCWGTEPFLTLTRSNFDEFRQRIPFDKLGKTFKDALISTRVLGFRYLWVASLCIVQDDREDWLKEAPNMGTVYANSSLTLAGIDSSDSESGLFFQRQPNELLGWRVKTRLPLKSGEFHEQRWDCVPSTNRESFQDNVLTSRAWVFQERFLSPRSLNFGRRELSWECRSRRACETSPYSQDKDISILSYSTKSGFETNSPKQWFEMLRHYTKGELTVASDKLPALSGIAQLLAKLSGKSYFAGLWKEDFLTQLLWRAACPAETRSQANCAPSWSWASIDTPISLIPRGRRPNGLARALISVQEFHLPPRQSPFLDCRGAYVRLKTPGLRSCRISMWKGEIGDPGFGNIGKYVIEYPGWDSGTRQSSPYSQVWMDVQDFDKNGKFYLLEVFADNHGLILQSIAVGEFIRVGNYSEVLYNEGDEQEERFEFYIRRLIDSEREILGDQTCLDENGDPLYVIKLL